MADTDALARSLPKREGVTYWALVPNLQGAERALEAGLSNLAVFTAASETFSKRNTNAGRAESLKAIAQVTRLNRRTRAYVSTCFGCPYEGAIPPSAVVETCKALLDLGVSEVSVSDTIGAGVPTQVEDVFGRLLALAPASSWAGHFHDTRGTALANVLAALNLGISAFDASAGGLGGCPFAPGASGNLATEDLTYLLQGMGIETGIDLERLALAAPPLQPLLGHSLPGKFLKAGHAPHRPPGKKRVRN